MTCHDFTEREEAEIEHLLSFPDLTREQARNARSESGYGVTLDGWSAFWPGVQCFVCHKFVGRDGSFSVDYFEMSSEIASVEAYHPRCVSEDGT